MNTNKMKYSLLCCVTAFFLLISGSAVAAAPQTENLYSGVTQTNPDQKVYVGGMPFGVRFSAGEVVVVRTNPFVSNGAAVSPAEEAGVIANDIIKVINGKKVSCIGDIVQAVSDADGSPIPIILQRGGKELRLRLTPQKCDDSHAFRLGVMLKDSSAGIGTVTFIQGNSLVFAGLGHGICDSASGEVLKIESGYISNVKINGIHRGQIGSPGELRGSLEEEKCGKLLSNTEVGVYGIFTEAPALSQDPIPIASMSEVQTGKATILCTLDDNKQQEYGIEITEINHNAAAKTKNYLVKVTDKRLLEKTGGIVQGMSGSPILQNGKLIGAITHVMINDPTTGYGIYIGNMLRELEKIV